MKSTWTMFNANHPRSKIIFTHRPAKARSRRSTSKWKWPITSGGGGGSIPCQESIRRGVKIPRQALCGVPGISRIRGWGVWIHSRQLAAGLYGAGPTLHTLGKENEEILVKSAGGPDVEEFPQGNAKGILVKSTGGPDFEVFP